MQVNLCDWQPVLQMLADSFGVRRLTIEASIEAKETRPDAASDARTMPLGLQPDSAGDAFTICLPESVNLFDRMEDNFGYYKVCLLHQLGYFEFGCLAAIDRVHGALHEQPDPHLAERLFVIAEDARIDWQLARRFCGLAGQLARQKDFALRQRRAVSGDDLAAACIEYLLRLGLDGDETFLGKSFSGEGRLAELSGIFAVLRDESASVDDSIKVMQAVYALLGSQRPPDLADATDATALPGEEGEGNRGKENKEEELPPPVQYRGELDVDRAYAAQTDAISLEELEEAEGVAPSSPPDTNPSGPPDTNPSGLPDTKQPGLPDKIEMEKGEVNEGAAIMADLPRPEQAPQEQNPKTGQQPETMLTGIGRRSSGEAHAYDEWDYEIADYRPRWCSLHEMRDLPLDEDYVPDTLRRHQALARRVRRQLSHLKPEMLVKVKGSLQGEELDLERAIDYLVDRRAGLTPDAGIYIERRRAARDVSTLFLLDMSASTDDIIPDPTSEPPPPDDEDDDRQLLDYFEARRHYEKNARRIIDLEKQSVALMAEALERLGDSYSVCGFSGYGRERVDYFLCKDFDEPWDAATKARLGGIKPHRSTRMGAPIRHATRSLLGTGSRVKALIIISDGYPQDHDYGGDRNNRNYGLNDTMKALMEARQQGVLAWCLTVDPSGHDYLRTMCPDHQYAVMQELEQLPEQLSRVYRTLTG